MSRVKLFIKDWVNFHWLNSAGLERLILSQILCILCLHWDKLWQQGSGLEEGEKWEKASLIAPEFYSSRQHLEKRRAPQTGFAEKGMRARERSSGLEQGIEEQTINWPPRDPWLSPEADDQGKPKTRQLSEKVVARDSFQRQKQCTWPFDNLLHPMSLLYSLIHIRNLRTVE